MGNGGYKANCGRKLRLDKSLSMVRKQRSVFGTPLELSLIYMFAHLVKINPTECEAILKELENSY